MRILRVQHTVDPRSYKIVNALRSESDFKVEQAVYDARADDQRFYGTYRTSCIQFGPGLFRDGPVCSNLNLVLEQANLMLRPFSHFVGKKIRKLSRQMKPAIIHTCGPPDVLGVVAKKVSELPVVHEIYDVYSLYDKPVAGVAQPGLRTSPMMEAYRRAHRKACLEWEEWVHNKCDALVYTSEEMQEWANEKYGPLKSTVIPNGVLREDLPVGNMEKLHKTDGRIHCVYTGAITDALAHRRILPRIQEVLTSRDIALHLYPVTDNAAQDAMLKWLLLRHPNLYLHKPLHYRHLYKELTRYDLGVVLLNTADERLLNAALPNKVFEYVSAGLPIAVPPYKSLESFVSKYGCGFTVHDWTQGILDGQNKIREVPFRDEFTMNYYLPRLLELYRQCY